jgi:serine/threonine-protein kinase
VATVEAGQILAGKLQVEGVLGRGGMGLVLIARHTILNERVAVKLMRSEGQQDPDPTQLERFYREARAAARLKGPHITRVMDVGTLDDGSPYIVMEYIEGVTLSETIRQRGPLPVDEAVDYLMQVCEGLAEAHALGIVHRDLKPSNLMLTRGIDGSPLLKILDFGIARYGESNQSTLTGSSVMLGSPSYMSPEQIRDAHRVDPRSDVWSLGVTLYELLTGNLPFEAFTPAGLIARISVDPPAPPGDYRPELPPALQQILLRCLEKSPEARFDGMADLADALLPFASPRSTQVVARIHRVFEEKQTPPSDPAAPAVRSATPTSPRTGSGGSTPPTRRSSPESFAATEQAHTLSTAATTSPPSLGASGPTPRRRWPWAVAGVVLLGVPAGLLLRAFGGGTPAASGEVVASAPAPAESGPPAEASAPAPPASTAEVAPLASSMSIPAAVASAVPGALGSAPPRVQGNPVAHGVTGKGPPAQRPAGASTAPSFATDFGGRK